jgi:site-specific recombinase XerD
MKTLTIVNRYVEYKQSVGQSFVTDQVILKAFCRHSGNIALQSISKKQVVSYLTGKLPISSYWKRKYTALAGFFQFSITRGYMSVSPLPVKQPNIPPPLAPYIYSRAELKQLLDATPACCSRYVKIDPIVIRTLIFMLYGACLRISEALSLTIKDLDLSQNTVIIQKTKFYKKRLVPLGTDLSKALFIYVKHRSMYYNNEPDIPLFCFQDGRALTKFAARSTFNRLRLLTGIQRKDTDRFKPRLHDLRHTGVVHRVIDWYRNASDLQYLLPQLATYLGHINLSATQQYLSLTPELLHEASQRFEKYAREIDHD